MRLGWSFGQPILDLRRDSLTDRVTYNTVLSSFVKLFRSEGVQAFGNIGPKRQAVLTQE